MVSSTGIYLKSATGFFTVLSLCPLQEPKEIKNSGVNQLFRSLTFELRIIHLHSKSQQVNIGKYVSTNAGIFFTEFVVRELMAMWRLVYEINSYRYRSFFRILAQFNSEYHFDDEYKNRYLNYGRLYASNFHFPLPNCADTNRRLFIFPPVRSFDHILIGSHQYSILFFIVRERNYILFTYFHFETFRTNCNLFVTDEKVFLIVLPSDRWKYFCTSRRWQVVNILCNLEVFRKGREGAIFEKWKTF